MRRGSTVGRRQLPILTSACKVARRTDGTPARRARSRPVYLAGFLCRGLRWSRINSSRKKDPAANLLVGSSSKLLQAHARNTQKRPVWNNKGGVCVQGCLFYPSSPDVWEKETRLCRGVMNAVNNDEVDLPLNESSQAKRNEANLAT